MNTPVQAGVKTLVTTAGLSAEIINEFASKLSLNAMCLTLGSILFVTYVGLKNGVGLFGSSKQTMPTTNLTVNYPRE